MAQPTVKTRQHISLPGPGTNNDGVSFDASIECDLRMNNGERPFEGGAEGFVEAFMKLRITGRRNDDEVTAKKTQDPLPPSPPQRVQKKPPPLITPPITPPQARTSRTSPRHASNPLPGVLWESSRIPGAWLTSQSSSLPAPQSPITSSQPTSSTPTDAYFTPPQSPERISLPKQSSYLRLPEARVVSDPLDSGASYICTAIKRDGKRCTYPAKPVTLSGPTPDASFVHYCGVHLNKALRGNTGAYSHAHSVDHHNWFTFDDWIPDNLSDQTRLALRSEMCKPVSRADKPGYVYAFEIKKPGSDDFVIKIGCSMEVTRRLDEWRTQCKSEVVLRGWWPGNIDDSVDPENRWKSVQIGAIEPGPRGKYCHRLEKLIHLELADIALNSHLMAESAKEPSGKNIKTRRSSGRRKSSPAAKRVRELCSGCGREHRERFTLKRVPSGRTNGKEWSEIVKPIMERWGRFVEMYAYESK